jgi:hypothetical protein
LIFSYLPQQPQKVSHTQVNNTQTDFTRDFEPRDRFVTLDVPDLPSQQQSEDNSQTNDIRKKKIESWVGEVCKISISIGFNYFMEKKVE